MTSRRFSDASIKSNDNTSGAAGARKAPDTRFLNGLKPSSSESDLLKAVRRDPVDFTPSRPAPYEEVTGSPTGRQGDNTSGDNTPKNQGTPIKGLKGSLSMQDLRSADAYREHPQQGDNTSGDNTPKNQGFSEGMREIVYYQGEIKDIRSLRAIIQENVEKSIKIALIPTKYYNEVVRLKLHVKAFQDYKSQLARFRRLEDRNRETIENTKESLGIRSQADEEDYDPYKNPYEREPTRLQALRDKAREIADEFDRTLSDATRQKKDDRLLSIINENRESIGKYRDVFKEAQELLTSVGSQSDSRTAFQDMHEEFDALFSSATQLSEQISNSQEARDSQQENRRLRTSVDYLIRWGQVKLPDSPNYRKGGVRMGQLATWKLLKARERAAAALLRSLSESSSDDESELKDSPTSSTKKVEAGDSRWTAEVERLLRSSSESSSKEEPGSPTSSTEKVETGGSGWPFDVEATLYGSPLELSSEEEPGSPTRSTEQVEAGGSRWTAEVEALLRSSSESSSKEDLGSSTRSTEQVEAGDSRWMAEVERLLQSSPEHSSEEELGPPTSSTKKVGAGGSRAKVDVERLLQSSDEEDDTK